MAVLLALVKIIINIHERNNTKHSKYSVHILSNTHKIVTKPTHTHTQTLQNPHIHTPTHYKTHTYTHPHITKPTRCSDISGYHTDFHEGHGTVGAGQGHGMASVI